MSTVNHRRPHAWNKLGLGGKCAECGLAWGERGELASCPGPLKLTTHMEVKRQHMWTYERGDQSRYCAICGEYERSASTTCSGPRVEPSPFKPTWDRVDFNGYMNVDGIATMLRALDPDPKRDGLKGTPDRVSKYWREMTSGHDVDIPSLFKTFDDQRTNYKDMIIVKDVHFVSHCEHHLALFHGLAHVGYIPDGNKIIGISKIARLVDAYARRLQVQERITAQVADTMMNGLGARGVIVVLTDVVHGCMLARGVRSHAVTTTSAVRGLFEEDQAARHEFLALIGRRQ